MKPVKPAPPVNATLITSIPPSAVDWTIKPSEREKYEKLFDSLQPLNGYISGNKVRYIHATQFFSVTINNLLRVLKWFDIEIESNSKYFLILSKSILSVVFNIWLKYLD